MIWQIILFSVAGGILSLIGGILLLIKKDWSLQSMLTLISFAAGVLLSVAFLEILPEALELAEGKAIPAADLLRWSLAAVVGFFFLEKSFVWFHHHHESHQGQPDPLVPMVWLSDTLHNAIDGLVITASFFVSTPLGVATAIAVGLHEIPQELADFSLYLSKGVSRIKTLSLNLLSSLATVLSAVAAYWYWDKISPFQPHLLAFTAGMFIYISCSDLIPELHGQFNRRKVWFQLIAFALGVSVTWGLNKIFKV